MVLLIKWYFLLNYTAKIKINLLKKSVKNFPPYI